MEDKEIAQYRHMLDYATLDEMKKLYNSATVEDDMWGEKVTRPDEERQQLIIEAAAQRIAETDSDWNPESKEPEPDFVSAAIDFLTRD